MELSSKVIHRTLVLTVQGRLDAFGSKEFEGYLETRTAKDLLCTVVDMGGVDYLSSAGLRVFLKLQQKLNRGGAFAVLANVQSYCLEVIELAGFKELLRVSETVDGALADCAQTIEKASSGEDGQAAQSFEMSSGTFRVLSAASVEGVIEVLGDISDVLYSRVTPGHLSSKLFFETEYSIGLGGLGNRIDDYFGIMGEMITIGGTMVWLPTDGNDTPDFLIPKTDTGRVTLKTAFNVSIGGGFNELLAFDSSHATGATMDMLYKDLFELSRRRRPDYKGVLGVTLRAQMSSVFGSGVKKSPVDKFAPSDGEMITHPAHFAHWFDADDKPRHEGVTALICGIGADLTRDLSYYDQRLLNSVFYLHPSNVGKQSMMLHNHGVIFSELPMSKQPSSLEAAIGEVVDNGDFCDMRHLLDKSALTQAVVGVSYIQSFRRDPRGTESSPQ
jgi:anti-anti-sigma factor